jgi:hypothetical protein
MLTRLAGADQRSQLQSHRAPPVGAVGADAVTVEIVT